MRDNTFIAVALFGVIFNALFVGFHILALSRQPVLSTLMIPFHVALCVVCAVNLFSRRS